MSEPASQAAFERARSLVTLEPLLPAGLVFTWHGRRCGCRIAESRGRVMAEITVELGAMPFSAEDGGARMRLLEILRHGGGDATGHYRLSDRGRFQYRGEEPIERPVSGAGIVAAVTRFMLRARPFLLLAAENGPRRRPNPYRRRA
ncbi:MAG: hypothetical protein FJX46_02745 [Alphaproteobacteria bacterium]|nr:hypothetical protein [Alphaproteobacteria bacterium]